MEWTTTATALLLPALAWNASFLDLPILNDYWPAYPAARASDGLVLASASEESVRERQQPLASASNDSKAQQKKFLEWNFETWESKWRLTGEQRLRLGAGLARTLRRQDPTAREDGNIAYQYWLQNLFDPNLPPLPNPPFSRSDLVHGGAFFDHQIKLNLKGSVGEKVEVEVRHDPSEANKGAYRIEYTGGPEEPFQRIALGDIPLNFSSGMELIPDPILNQQGLGLQLHRTVGPVRMQSIVSWPSTLSEVKTFSFDQKKELVLRDLDYTQKTYFVIPDGSLEPGQEAGYYEEITDRDRYGEAALVCREVLVAGGGSIKKYFRKVPSSKYSLQATTGLFTLKKAPPSGYSLLLVGPTTNNSGNAAAFFGSNYRLEFVDPEASRPEAVGVLVLHVPESELRDSQMQDHYESRLYYPIPKGIEVGDVVVRLEDRHGVLADARVWNGGLRHRFEHVGEATINPKEGWLRFEQNKALSAIPGPGHYGGMYEVAVPDVRRHHRLQLRIEVADGFDGRLDLGRFGVVPSSVVVYKNGKPLDRSTYSATPLGLVEFDERANLHKGSQVEVHYEYEPVGGGFSQTLLGLRVDLLAPFPNNRLSVVGMVGLDSSDSEGVRIGEEPTRHVVGGARLDLDLVSVATGRAHNAHKLNLNSEVAFSMFNPNSKNQALVHSPESALGVFRLDLDSDHFYFTANPQLEALANLQLGRSYYIDFSAYSQGGKRRPVEFRWKNELQMRHRTSDSIFTERQDINFRRFEEKSGPYHVTGVSHLNPLLHPEKKALVLDYDVGQNAAVGYVSFITPLKPAPSRWDEFTTLEVVYKLLPASDSNANLMPSPGSVGLTIEVGNLNEDLDLDNHLDEEPSLFDVDGFEFNYNQKGNQVTTQLGGDRRPKSHSQEGNRIQDTEDLNHNGQLDALNAQEESLYTYPSSGATPNAAHWFVLMNSQRLSQQAQKINASTFEWNGVFYEVLEAPDLQSDKNDPYVREPYIRMKMHLATPSDDGLMALEKVSHLRLNLIHLSASLASRGKVVIEGLSFRQNPWEAIHVDGVRMSHGRQFAFETLEAADDDAYASNPFAKAHLKTHEVLHGSLLNSELEVLAEKTYQVEYNLNGELWVETENSASPSPHQGRFAWAEAHLFGSEDAVDLSKYQTFNVAIYPHRTSPSGEEEFVYRFGEDDANHFELRLPMRFIQEGNEGRASKRWTILVIHLQVEDATQGAPSFLLSKRTLEVLPFGNRSPSEEKALAPDQYRFSKQGRPRLSRTQYYAIGIDSLGNPVEGRFWVQNFFAAEPRLQVGHATKNTLTYKQQTPLNINNRELLRDLSIQMGHEYRGLGFRNFEESTEGGQEEGVQLLLSATLGRVWSFSFEQSQHYERSEHSEALLSKEDQSLLVRDLKSFSTLLDFGSHPILPTLRHSVEVHAIRELGFETLSDPEGNRHYSSVLNESIIETTTLSEQKPFLFSRNLGFEQQVQLQVSFHKEALFERPVRLNDAILYNPQEAWVYPASLWNEHVWRKRFPIWDGFPDPTLPMEERLREAKLENAAIKTLQYKVEHERHLGLKMFLYQLQLDMRYEAANAYQIELWDATEGEPIGAGREPYAVWDSPYWNRWEGLFGIDDSDQNAKPVGRKHAYRVAFSHLPSEGWGDSEPPSFLSGLRGEVHYETTEKHFREVVSPFAADEFWYYQSRRLLSSPARAKPSRARADLNQLQNYVDEIAQFYSNPRPYKTIENSMQWTLELPITKPLRLRFARRLFRVEENVLDLTSADLSGSEKQLWQGIENDFEAYNLDLKGAGVVASSWRELGGLMGLPPYFDFWFLQDVLYWGLQPWLNPKNLDRTKTIFMNSYRFWVAEEVDEKLQKTSRAQGPSEAPHIASFQSHQDYASDLKVSDSFALEWTPAPQSFWKFLVPEQLSYSGSLSTEKSNGMVRQSESRSLSLRKQMNAWLERLLASPHHRLSDRLQAWFSLSYSRSQDYATKTLTTQHGHAFGVEVGAPKGLRVGGAIAFERTRTLYPLRYRFVDTEGDDHYAPYMGIGPYYEVVVSNAFLGTEETLNLGEFENVHQVRSTEDLGGDLLDLEERTRRFSVRFALSERRAFDFLRGLSVVPLVRSSLELSVALVGYEVPYVDEEAVRGGATSLAEQPNGVAAKNLALLFDPVPLGNFIEDWVLSIEWKDLYEFGQTFRIESALTIAFLSQFIARSYQAYLKVDSQQNLPPSFLREEDTIQLGLDFSLTMKLLF